MALYERENPIVFCLFYSLQLSNQKLSDYVESSQKKHKKVDF